VTIHRVAVVGNNAADFSVTSNCSDTIVPGGQCEWTVTFAPTPQTYIANGVERANLVIYDNAPGSPHTVRLAGQGTALSVNPDSLNFGQETIGTPSVAQSITIHNVWISPINFASIESVGDYAQTNDCGQALAPGARCTVYVTFTPKVQGTDNGLLNLNSDDGASPKQVVLQGIGLAP